MSNDVKQVRTALARAVAGRKLSDEAIDAAAKQLSAAKFPIRGIDICTLGICLDYLIDGEDWANTLPDLLTLEGAQLKGLELFPWGIVNPDIVHVRVTQRLDALSALDG